MLFYPKQPVNLLIFKLQGIFPKRQKEFASKIAQTIAQEILSVKDLIQQINTQKAADKIKLVIAEHLDNHLANKLKDNFPMLAMFINDSMINQFKGIFLEELDVLLPNIVESFTKNLDEEIDIKKTVEEKVAAFSTDKFEEVINHILSKELRFIEIIGAVLGFIIGLLQIYLLRFL